MTTYAQFPLSEACQIMVDELDSFITRIVRRDPYLVLERESDLHWIVVDVANDEAVMRRTTDCLAALSFMRMFSLRHPEATVVFPKTVAGEPQAQHGAPATRSAGLARSVSSASVAADEPASPAQHLEIVR